MPIFKYLVLNGKKAPEYIEVEQSIGSPPLSKHPISGEPLKKFLIHQALPSAIRPFEKIVRLVQTA